jgi:hypothetical protein
MTPGDKKKRFDGALKEQLQERTRILTNTRDEVMRLLNVASDNISVVLASQPTDYQQWYLPDLQFEISRVLQEFSEAAEPLVGSAAGDAWQAGQNLTDLPLAAAGEAGIVRMMPLLNTNQLMAMRSFTTHQIKGLSTGGANLINTQLGLVVIGVQSPGEAIASVRNILGDQSKSRASSIVRTELGSVYSIASNQRMMQAHKAGVPMNKMWLRSGKIHPRPGHNMAHGQTVPVDQPFNIPSSTGGMPTLMMHPHDPKAPLKERINCGCTDVPVVDFTKPITLGGFVSSIRSTITAQ